MKRLSLILMLLAAHSAMAKVLSNRGIASWYSDSLRGKIMANGKPYDPEAMTCACWDYPMGATLRVTRMRYGQKYLSVYVNVTDRGPAKKTGRVIDLSRAAFFKICPLENGLCGVMIEEVK